MWQFIAYFVVSLIVAVAMTPKTETQPPAGLSEFDVPTAEIGREIPVLFGTRDVGGPNVVWYGDFKVTSTK